MEGNFKKFISVKDAAELLGVSRSLLYDQVYACKIPHRRIGKRILIPMNYIRELQKI